MCTAGAQTADKLMQLLLKIKRRPVSGKITFKWWKSTGVVVLVFLNYG
jgi:hypothetical protein